MTIEEYHLLPEHPGWKSEYWDGKAHLTPRSRAVVTMVNVEPRRVNAPCHLRAAQPKDTARLVGVYAAAFNETIEYCDYSKKQVRASARRALDDHFVKGRRGQPLPGVSQVAFDKASGKETLVGAALVVRSENGPLLDLLFVSPDCQRGGVATALVSAAVNQLHNRGEQRLASQYHIGNDQSRAWHQRFGFVEEPDLTRARLYRRCARHELWRRGQLGDLTGEEHAGLKAECGFWEAQVEQLKRIEDEQGFKAVHPMERW